MKRAVEEAGLVRDVWVTKTHCLGICPKVGATVAQYPSETPILTEVEPEHAPSLVAEPRADEVIEILESLEALQRKKVLDLARRLKPGLTLEDIQNPHDFPELDDPDWHYADGVLTGIASVRSALAARRR
jgi:(2Fe-2S) ferredoxin